MKPLASATTTDGQVVSGTRDTLAIGDLEVPWERVHSADWDKESATLVVSVVDGEPRRLALTEPGRLVQLVRERVTASVVLQRHVPVSGRRGVVVVGRRAPSGRGSISWTLEFEAGIDPADPGVQAAAESALRQAREDVGDL